MPSTAKRTEVTRDQINEFLVRAIRLAADRPDLNIRVLKANVTESGNVRFDLDNGDIVLVSIEHLVPR